MAFPYRSTLSHFDDQEENHFSKFRVHLGFITWYNSELLEATFDALIPVPTDKKASVRARSSY